jgi:hypothetical protein
MKFKLATQSINSRTSNRIQEQALRLITGAVKTTPIDAMEEYTQIATGETRTARHPSAREAVAPRTRVLAQPSTPAGEEKWSTAKSGNCPHLIYRVNRQIERKILLGTAEYIYMNKFI